MLVLPYYFSNGGIEGFNTRANTVPESAASESSRSPPTSDIPARSDPISPKIPGMLGALPFREWHSQGSCRLFLHVKIGRHEGFRAALVSQLLRPHHLT